MEITFWVRPRKEWRPRRTPRGGRRKVRTNERKKKKKWKRIKREFTGGEENKKNEEKNEHYFTAIAVCLLYVCSKICFRPSGPMIRINRIRTMNRRRQCYYYTYIFLLPPPSTQCLGKHFAGS